MKSTTKELDPLGKGIEEVYNLLPPKARKFFEINCSKLISALTPNKQHKKFLAEAYPHWPQEGMQIKDIKLTYIKKHDLADQFESQEHEHKSKARYVPITTYEGSLCSPNDIEIPFRVDTAVRLDTWGSKNPHTITYIMYGDKASILNGFIIDSEVQSSKKDMKHIFNDILLTTLEKHFSIKEFAYRNDFRREDIIIKTPASIIDQENAKIAALQEIHDYNMIPSTLLYEDQGAKTYWEIFGNPSYSKTQEKGDNSIITENINTIKQYVQGSEYFIDLGPGNGEKVIRMISRISDFRIREKYKYIGADSSLTSLMYLGRSKGGINNYKFIDFDLRRDLMKNIKKYKNIGPKTIALLGGTLGNYRKDDRQHLLHDTIVALQPEESLLLSVFTTNADTDIREVINSYNTPLSKKFAFDALEQLGFNTHNVDYAVRYEEESQTIVMEAIFNDTQKIERGNTAIIKNKGDSIIVAMSKRFSQEEINTMIEEAGGIIKQSYLQGSTYFVVVQKIY